MLLLLHYLTCERNIKKQSRMESFETLGVIRVISSASSPVMRGLFICAELLKSFGILVCVRVLPLNRKNAARQTDCAFECSKYFVVCIAMRIEMKAMTLVVLWEISFSNFC